MREDERTRGRDDERTKERERRNIGREDQEGAMAILYTKREEEAERRARRGVEEVRMKGKRSESEKRGEKEHSKK